MSIFDAKHFDEHEHVSFFADPTAGLRAIVAIHRTGPLGTAGGGCRIWPYRDEAEALEDALRLSRAMTYKLALLELPAGGAKAVVMGDPSHDKSEALLLALGRAVDRLGGRFIVSEDVGTGPRDLEVVARQTLWVNRHAPGADTAGATAYGVLVGIRAAAKRRLGRAQLDGVRVAVQGLGRVGRLLAGLLAEAGARLTVTDLEPGKREEARRSLGATVVEPEAIFDQDADVLAPCALADAIDEHTIGRLRCKVVAGSANNQLADPRLADELARREILYAPDIVINAGGALGAASGVSGDERALRARIEGLGVLLDGVFARAERERISTHAAAERTAQDRLRAMGVRP
jgi:leucine dehydrogenase